MKGLFDGMFATPGGGILQGLTDPNGTMSPNSPQMWGAPGGYGFADLSSIDPITPYDKGRPPNFPAFPELLGLGPWPPVSTSQAGATPGSQSQAPSGPAAGLQSSPGPGNTSAPALPNGAPAPEDGARSAFLSRVGQALHDNSSMLMAMGGGMMTGGIGKGLQAGAATADESTSRRQAPQTVKVSRPGGGEMLMMWDPGQRRYVPAPIAGLPSSGSASAPAMAAGYEGMTATNPQTGQRITFRNGQWQTM